MEMQTAQETQNQILSTKSNRGKQWWQKKVISQSLEHLNHSYHRCMSQSNAICDTFFFSEVHAKRTYGCGQFPGSWLSWSDHQIRASAWAEHILTLKEKRKTKAGLQLYLSPCMWTQTAWLYLYFSVSQSSSVCCSQSGVAQCIRSEFDNTPLGLAGTSYSSLSWLTLLPGE